MQTTHARITSTSIDSSTTTQHKLPSIPSAPLLLQAQDHVTFANDWIEQFWHMLSNRFARNNNDTQHTPNQARTVQQTHAETTFTAGSTMRNVVKKSSQHEEKKLAIPSKVTPAGLLPGQVLNNPPPTNIPSARLAATLIDAGDGSHMLLPVIVGSSSPDATVPDSKSVAVQLVVDTGSSDLVLYNKNCKPPVVNCDTIGSAGLSPLPTPPFVFALGLDGENYTSTGSFSKNLLTLPLYVLGTHQKEYIVRNTLFYVFDAGTVMEETPANPSNMVGSDPSSYYLVNADYYENADGVLGLNYKNTALLALNGYHNDGTQDDADDIFTADPTGFQAFINDPTPFFSFNFHAKKFYLGGVDEEYRSKLLWSDGPATNIVEDLHSFRIYRMGLCGVNLFENVTSSWHAIVDTGSSCLGLPSEFYDMVISWLPLQCTLGNYDSLPHVCYITPEVRQILPTLSFRLSENGQDLYIDLAALIFPLPYMNRTCIYRSASILGGQNPYNAIVFGSRLMHQFYAAFDMSSEKVGFANVNDSITESTVQCAARVICTGMQVHNDALNMCLPPPCEDYYFFAYEDSTKECRLSTGFHILTGIIIGLFVFAEFGLNELVIHLSNKVHQNAFQAGR